MGFIYPTIAIQITLFKLSVFIFVCVFFSQNITGVIIFVYVGAVIKILLILPY